MTQIQSLQNLVLDALEVVEFKLVRSREDINDDTKTFHPAMAHQIFGENENIFGYKDLKVNILYTAGPLQTYIGSKYGSKIDDENADGIKADDVIGTIASKLPDGCYFTNMDEFLKTLDKADDFRPIGEKLHEFESTDVVDGSKRLFEIYKSDCITPKFCNFFSRLQTFILWFVDAASYIDIDDPQWNYFVCYEKFKNSNGNEQYATAGYTTIYKYYAYPEHTRPRISQMLVLPPFQKLGIGTKFLETLYKFYVADSTVVDITVEDPSEDFSRIRNFVDSKLCKDLPSFAKDVIKSGFNLTMVKEAREKFKINPKQCRVVYEILRLYHTNIHDEPEYKKYRLDIKKRLNSTYHKQIRDMKKMEKAKVDTQFMKATLPTMEERMEQLADEFKEVEDGYEQIVDKLMD